MLYERDWRLTFYNRRSLVTCDAPVVLGPMIRYPDGTTVAVGTAAEVQVPLDRRVALSILSRRRRGDERVRGVTKTAMDLNRATAGNARRHVFHHPDDDPLHGLALPQPPRTRVGQPGGGGSARCRPLRRAQLDRAASGYPQPSRWRSVTRSRARMASRTLTPARCPRSLADLGVRRVCAVHRPDGEPGSVLVAQAGPAGPFSVSTVPKAAECELWKPDNIAKLSGSTGRAELFVWMDAGTAQAALCTLILPEFAREQSGLRPPSLPAGVTGVWVATGSAGWPQPVAALLRSDGRAWSVMELPACRAAQIEIHDGTGPGQQTRSRSCVRVHW